MTKKRILWSVALSAGVALGCDGRVSTGPAGPLGEETGNASGDSGVHAASSFLCKREASVDPGPSPLQRLTPSQYVSTARDLFGSQLTLDDVLPQESAGYIGMAQPDPSRIDIESYGAAAKRVGEYVETRATTFAPCSTTASLGAARPCARNMLKTLGTRIYRAPLTDEEVERLVAVFDIGFANGGYPHGIALVVRTMMHSPRFLYRPEFGDPSTLSESALLLSNYEMASRLSFAFWNRGPDQELLDAAAAGTLATEEGVVAQARRLMADDRAQESFRDFFRGWFGFGDLLTQEKNSNVFPQWSEPTRKAIIAQGDAFLDALLFKEEDTVEQLFELDSTSLLPDAMSDWKTTGGDGKAVGLLALPALLTRHSKPDESFPIYRGLFVREQLLCQPLPPPPPNVGDPPTPMAGVRGRERFEQHSSSASCSGCHSRIDPLGFAFENYDAIGMYRTTEEGQPIDASGTLTGTDVDGDFKDLAGLSARLARSATVRQCVTRQWFRHVLQRFERPEDGCSMLDLYDNFEDSGHHFAALRESIVKTAAFRMRRVIQTETP